MREYDFGKLRRGMVEAQIMARGISDPGVVGVMLRIPRERFMDESLAGRAYSDCALPLSHGQTISQPYMVAFMTEALSLRGKETVLEIGSGSGYQTAILAELAGRVYSVERLSTLSRESERITRELGYANISFMTGDGTLGWKEHAPFERIIVTAGAPRVPKSLEEQLAEGGRMVIPVGSRESQVLELIEKKDGKMSSKPLCGCTFVPLVGEEAWQHEKDGA